MPDFGTAVYVSGTDPYAAIAATNPELSKAARGDVLKSLGIFTESNEANAETIRQGIKYTLSRTENVGTWLTITGENEAS